MENLRVLPSKLGNWLRLGKVHVKSCRTGVSSFIRAAATFRAARLDTCLRLSDADVAREAESRSEAGGSRVEWDVLTRRLDSFH
jgi:hypothetical protein